MGVKVEVGEGQDIETALLQLRSLIQEEYERPYCKPRQGYFEKKSTLGHKRKKMQRDRAQDVDVEIGWTGDYDALEAHFRRTVSPKAEKTNNS